MLPKVSQVLLKTRQSKYLTLDQVAKSLKIQTKFLKALESGDFNLFSSDVQIQGFLKNYAAYLGLNALDVLAFYRRDFGDLKSKDLTTTDLTKRITLLTPHKVTVFIVLLLFVFFAAYLFNAYQNFSRAPLLVLENPAGDALVRTLQVDVRGFTCPTCALSINGQAVGVDAAGKFSANLALRGGTNQLTVVAVSRAGKESKIVRNIVVEP